MNKIITHIIALIFQKYDKKYLRTIIQNLFIFFPSNFFIKRLFEKLSRSGPNNFFFLIFLPFPLSFFYHLKKKIKKRKNKN